MHSMLFDDSLVWGTLNSTAVPILLTASEDDHIVLSEDISQCYQRMLDLGVPVTLKKHLTGGHAWTEDELFEVSSWIIQRMEQL